MGKGSMNGSSGHVFTLLIAVSMVVGMWVGTDYVASRLRGLEITKMKQLSEKQSAPIKPTFHRISAKAIKGNANGEPTSSPFEDVFASVEPASPVLNAPVAPVPPPPSYAAIIRPQLRVDGVTDNGAFVGGWFVRLGARVEHLAHPGGDAAPLPVSLVAVSKDLVKFKVGAEQIQVSVNGEVN